MLKMSGEKGLNLLFHSHMNPDIGLLLLLEMITIHIQKYNLKICQVLKYAE